MTEKIAFIFPGQGSQEVGMGKDLAAAYPAAKAVFEQADDILGLAFSKIAWEGPEDTLNDTYNTQAALFIHSMATLAVIEEKFPELDASYMAGHSLGELTALTAAGAMSFADGLKLVRRRGELMREAGEVSPGSMAAFLALDIPTVEQVCADASQGEEMVQIANDNCPGQVVVSGDAAAVERSLAIATEAGARKAVPLAVSVAAHSYLMAHAQEDFNAALTDAKISTPNIPVIGNVAAKPLTSVAEVEADLRAQLTSRVRWTESVEYMLSQGITRFIEIGTGDVLIGLIKRIDRKVTRQAVGKPENVEGLAEE